MCFHNLCNKSWKRNVYLQKVLDKLLKLIFLKLLTEMPMQILPTPHFSAALDSDFSCSRKLLAKLNLGLGAVSMLHMHCILSRPSENIFPRWRILILQQERPWWKFWVAKAIGGAVECLAVFFDPWNQYSQIKCSNKYQIWKAMNYEGFSWEGSFREG